MNALSSALSAIRRSPYQALAAIATMTLTFTVIFALSTFLVGSEVLLRYYETRPQVIGFFEIKATDEQITAAQQAMEAKSYVSTVTITTQEEALQLYSEEFADSPLLLELITPEILPASIEVSPTDISALTTIHTDLENLDGIEAVDFQESVAAKLESWSDAARRIGITVAAALVLLSLLTNMVIIGMKVVTKKNAITVLRLIGATGWYIKRPFMMEGIVYGITGCFLGFGVTLGILLYLTPTIESFITEVPLIPIPWEFFGIQLGIGLVLSSILGGLAGLFATQRLIRT